MEWLRLGAGFLELTYKAMYYHLTFLDIQRQTAEIFEPFP
jgi:hypothetical protein